MTTNTVDIVVLNHDYSAEHLRRCLYSIRNYTAEPNTIIVADSTGNPSASTEVHQLRWSNLTLLSLRGLTLSQLCKQGIRAGRSPFIVLTEAENEFYEGWLTAAFERFQHNPRLTVTEITRGEGANGQFPRPVFMIRRAAISPDTISKFVGRYETAHAQGSTAQVKYADVNPLNINVSVIIPTKNAGDSFLRLLTILRRQKYIGQIEIIIVDSGSTDGTLQTAKRWSDKVLSISSHDFTHAYARNLGAAHATGNLLLFTVQDALPPSETWLYDLATFLLHNELAAVSAAELPREDADLFYSAVCWNHYEFLGVNGRDRIMSRPRGNVDHVAWRKNAQLSDIACLIRSSLFTRYKHRLDYAEDLDLGMRLITDGHRIGFLGTKRIIHSHNRPPYYFLKRSYMDVITLSNMFPDIKTPNIAASRLADDIRYTAEVVRSLVLERLPQLTLPMSVRDLRQSVMAHINQMAQSERRTLAIGTNRYMGTEFAQLLLEVDRLNRLTHPAKYNGVLLYALRAFINITFDYMETIYTTLDDYVIEDFKTSIYKQFASKVGGFLGYSYLNTEADNLPWVQSIHARLYGGV